MGRGTGLVAALVAAFVLAAPAGAGAAGLDATIRRTAHGIPHILARDWKDLGYGYAYAFAQDNLCVMADDYVTVAAQRSRWFDPKNSYASRGNGTTINNLDSDFFWQRIIDTHVVEKLVAEAPPRGPVPEIKEIVDGYVAGYDQYLRDTGLDNLPDPTCRGKPWVRPITEMDVYRRFYQLGLLASQGVAVDGIAQAAPPTPAGGAGAQGVSATPRDFETLEARLNGIGSNAIGLGRAATDNGRGMVLANPHFPWEGTERFYQAHLRIPGKLDVTGASLFGVPLVLIGHTDGLAWSHTVSTAFRFTPFELHLVPGSPTTYVYDGQPREMTADKVTVQVRGADGKLAPQTRTLYSSVQGPIFTSILGLPLFPWTPTTAYAMGDANAGNFRFLNHFFFTDQAQSVDDLDRIERGYEGIPWVNTIAADADGNAYYADIGSIPNVPDAKAARCVNGALGQVAMQVIGLPILDGSQSSCAWDNDPDAVVPGIFGPGHEPSLRRDDYVENSNDSFWLSNPHQPLTGFAHIIGDTGTPRSLRTRNGLTMIEAALAGGGHLSLQGLQDLVFNDRQYAAALWKDQLVAMCEANPTLTGASGPVDVSAACPVLRAYDGHDDLDSKGAILFRRFVERALSAEPSPFSQPFSADDPVNTPAGLDTGNPQVRAALADAVSDLRNSNIPLDAPLRDYQYVTRNGERIPIHGGPGTDSLFNAINTTWTAGKGYPGVPHGSSFVMVTQFTGGCPQNRSILTYSQSTDPQSPWYADQTRLFSRKEWVDPPFCERDVLADPSLEVTRLTPAGARLEQARGPCATSSALGSVAVRPRGRGLRLAPDRALPGGLSADVFRVSAGRRILGPQRVAHLTGANTWAAHGLGGGYYVVRVSVARAGSRRVALRRVGGRFHRTGALERRSGCGLLTVYRLSLPVFGGRGARALTVAYRVAARASTVLRVTHGRRTLRTIRLGRVGAGPARRVRIRAAGLPRGKYRIRISLRSKSRRLAASLTARRL